MDERAHNGPTMCKHANDPLHKIVQGLKPNPWQRCQAVRTAAKINVPAHGGQALPQNHRIALLWHLSCLQIARVSLFVRVCVCVCVRVWVCVCVRARACACVGMYVCNVCIGTYIQTYMPTCMYARLFNTWAVCLSVDLSVCLFVCGLCLLICMCNGAPLTL